MNCFYCEEWQQLWRPSERTRKWSTYLYVFRKSNSFTINPLLSPPGGLFIWSPFEGGGLNGDEGLIREGGGLYNLETTMVSVLHKELEYEVEKLKYKKF